MAEARDYWDNVCLILDEVIDNYRECREYLDKALENIKELRSELSAGNIQAIEKGWV